MNSTVDQNHKIHFYTVDLLRFLCALVVALLHLNSVHLSSSPDSLHLTWFGWAGVQVFFVISGLVIIQSANGTTFGRFVWSRFLRLYPTAFVCVVINTIFYIEYYGISDTSVVLSQIIRSAFLWFEGPYLAGSYWTLPIELVFYMLISTIIYFGKIQSIGLYSAILCVLSSIYILFYSAFMFGFNSHSFLEFGYGPLNLTLLRHGIYFSLGIFLWLRIKGFSRTSDNIFIFISLIFASLEMLATGKLYVEIFQVDEFKLENNFHMPLLFFYTGVATLAFASSWNPAKGTFKFTGKILRILGLTTYPWYLIHLVVGTSVKMRTEKYLNIDPGAFTLLLTLLTTFIMAMVVALWLEPALRKYIVKIGLATTASLKLDSNKIMQRQGGNIHSVKG